jgi:formylglycine-generating enzyme required for sulfatase activity
MTPPLQREQLFISYSHADRDWVDRLQKMIRPLERSHGLRLWDDSQIPAGAKWRQEIETALATAKVALLLVSADFLDSEFVTNHELPPLLEAAEAEGLSILWVPLRPSLVEVTPIQAYQAVLSPKRPLAAMNAVEQEEALKTIGLAIQEKLASRPATPPPASAPSSPAQSAPAPSQPATHTPPGAPVPLQRFSTTTCRLHQENGRWRMERRPLEVEGYREELGPGVALTMVQIPAGSFLMGSPANEPERLDREGPQHDVHLGAFFLAQTPISQAQWRHVAQWKPAAGGPAWQLELDPDPSHFKGDALKKGQRPVECVSWLEAMEFCRRLSQRTGRTYALPSELQWEYACRAGSTTPFYFGATLTPDLANYDGNFVYGNGPKGAYRQQTTDVASFPANAWGLHDLHGNVWEWCADHWHDSYDFAPGDDQPWLIPAAAEDAPRLLRGGSWGNLPRTCRSAFRVNHLPDVRDDHVGFRVCCLPQD